MRNFWLSLLLLAGLSFANNADNKNISLASGFGGYVFGEGYVTQNLMFSAKEAPSY